MKLITGNMYFVKDSFFELINDPYLMMNHPSTKRPHYYAFKDRHTDLYWLIPCSSKIEKYERILAQRKKYGRPTDTIKIVKIWGKKSALLLQDMFPISEKYIYGPYIRKGKIVGVTDDKVMQEIETAANHVVNMIRAGIRFCPYQPNVMRIEKILLEESS